MEVKKLCDDVLDLVAKRIFIFEKELKIEEKKYQKTNEFRVCMLKGALSELKTLNNLFKKEMVKKYGKCID